jgi:hypothetical protein
LEEVFLDLFWPAPYAEGCRIGFTSVSPSSVYRVLIAEASKDLVLPHIFGKPHREKVKPDRKAPHDVIPVSVRNDTH